MVLFCFPNVRIVRMKTFTNTRRDSESVDFCINSEDLNNSWAFIEFLCPELGQAESCHSASFVSTGGDFHIVIQIGRQAEPYRGTVNVWNVASRLELTCSPSSSSSSFYWASVANTPNVLQPYWLIVLPLDVPDLTASLLLWGPRGQRWRCLWTFLSSNVSIFATSRLQEIPAAKCGITWARNGRWILPENARLLRNIQGSFTCHKSTTWDRRLYFPSEGRRSEGFFFSPWKIQRLRSGLNPRTWASKASAQPLDHRSRTCLLTGSYYNSEWRVW